MSTHMNSRYQYFKQDSDKEFVISSMRKYIDEKQEIDKFLEKLISPFLKTNSLKILDACCGIGHLPYFLSDINPEIEFLGIDQTEYLIDEAKKICNNKKNVQFEAVDVFDFVKNKQKEFDICINWKTLSWISYYTDFMKALFKVTKKHIFLSALFYDGDIDFEIKVREFKKEAGKNGFNLYYNIYSYPQFEKFVKSLGAKNIESFDFEIEKDIPKSSLDVMGTYTEKLQGGKKLQISGAVIMSWKVIHIEL